MKKNIVALTISGCELCASFKELLRSNNIPHHELDANVHSVMSDKVEVILGVYHYPILILTDDTADITYCYRTTENALLGHRILPTGDHAYGFFTLGELFNHINK